MKLHSRTLIHHFLEESATTYPRKIALVHGGIRASYEEINFQSNSLACYLIERGLNWGDRVTLLFENCLEYVTAYYASLKAGAAVAPLNTDLKPEGLRKILFELDPKALISSSRYEKLLKAAETWSPTD
jgi:acyl-CoA synthetase (AMP-forming)/AMP-acid ligase II